MSTRVVALGEAMLRLSPPGRGRLQAARSLDLHVAGSELNVAVALARLGVDAAWVSALPDSALGRLVAEEGRRQGVDMSHVRWVPGRRVGVFFVEFGAAPRPSSVLYDRADSAFAAMTPDQLDPAVLDGARYAIVSGITVGVSPGSAALALRFAEEARRRGVAVCVDVNYRAGLWTSSDARTGLEPLLAQADLVVCAERDARRLLGLDGEEEQILRAVRAAWAPRAETVVLTRGAAGSIASGGTGDAVRQPAFPARVVDRLGVGDAFVAGLVHGLIEGDLPSALATASALAALKCTIPGDHVVVTPAELASLVAGGQEQLVR